MLNLPDEFNENLNQQFEPFQRGPTGCGGVEPPRQAPRDKRPAARILSNATPPAGVGPVCNRAHHGPVNRQVELRLHVSNAKVKTFSSPPASRG